MSAVIVLVSDGLAGLLGLALAAASAVAAGFYVDEAGRSSPQSLQTIRLSLVPINRALRFMLVGLAVVVVAGCGGEQKDATPLAEWASTVCIAFDSYVTEDVKRSEDELGDIRLAVFGIDDPADVDFDHPPKLREDAAQLISQERLLLHVEHLKAADRAIIEKLEALPPPPDTDAGRFGGRMLDDEIGKVRENLEFLQEEVEKPVREEYPADPTPVQAVKMLDLALVATGPPYFAGLSIADLVAYASVLKKVVGAELLQAFKDAQGCDSWAENLAESEQIARDQYQPTVHSLTRVESCLRSKGMNVERDESVQLLLVRTPLQVGPGGLRQHLTLRFYPTSREAHNEHEVLKRDPSLDVRRLDNVIYDRPPQGWDAVLAEIEGCIRPS